MAGFKRLLAGQPNKKQPINSHHVRALFRFYGHPRASLPNLQMVSLVALGFCAFLRWSELRDLRACDLKFCATYMWFAWLTLRELCCMQQYGEMPICPNNSDGLTLLDDIVSLPQVDMLKHFWAVPLWYPRDCLFIIQYVCLMNIALSCFLICFCHWLWIVCLSHTAFLWSVFWVWGIQEMHSNT